MISANDILRVTFDSNVLKRVLCPDASDLNGQVINESLRTGRIEGFVAQTYFTKEATDRSVREDVLRMAFRRYRDPLCKQDKEGHKFIADSNKSKILRGGTLLNRKDILALMRQYRIRILHTYLFGDVQLRPQLEVGDFRIEDIQSGDFYKWNGNEEDVEIRNAECFHYIHEVLKAGVLSVDSLDVADGNLIGEDGARILKFKNPSAEEADMQAIATHYAHQLDIFCTEDKGRSAGGNSVMKPMNKQALAEKYEIQFCTLSELAHLISHGKKSSP